MTATTTELTPAARTYLRRATWGLPRDRQQEVWDELEEHLLTRAAQLQACGAAPPEALSRALAELGSPAHVSAGMTGVYLMPKLILMASAGALALSAALYALAGGSGSPLSLPVLTSRPAGILCLPATGNAILNLPVASSNAEQTCYQNAQPGLSEGIFIPANALRDAVNAQGGSAEFLGGQYLNLRFPDGSALGLPPAFIQGNQPYIGAEEIVNRGLINGGNVPPIMLSGFEAPTLKIGGAVLRLQKGSAPYGRDFYRRMQFGLVVGGVYGGTDGIPTETIQFRLTEVGSARHQIATALQPGEVVMLVTRPSSEQTVVDIAEVGAGGALSIESGSEYLRLVNDPVQLRPTSADGRTPALLVRVTNIPLNNLKSGIFVPDKTTSDAD